MQIDPIVPVTAFVATAALIVSLVTYYQTRRRGDLKWMYDMLHDLWKQALVYPDLNDEALAANFPSKPGPGWEPDMWRRHDAYKTMIWNFLQSVALRKLHKKSDVRTIFEHWARLHWIWFERNRQYYRVKDFANIAREFGPKPLERARIMLQEWLEDAGCTVEYCGGNSTTDELRGRFVHSDPPIINVYRRYAGTPGDAFRELAILTHEAGHFLSWKRGLVDLSLHLCCDDAIQLAALDEKTRISVLTEELRAWTLGEDKLSELAPYIGAVGKTFRELRTETLERDREKLNIKLSLADIKRRIGAAPR